ncbi:MAG TPA: transposase [Actinocrinis sp.]|jgi:transposase|uniref:transposase n=1 Tax=Actinocrinis sp. TaxID=1920516 RepID=UPI002DDDA622|nr:transposase [Actinocrinis sp.]HEV3170688.1 transposase [Actinocrinis sp.]
MGQRKAYRTDLSDEEWALIEPTLTAWRAGRRFIKEATTPLRKIVNAVVYQNRTGRQWDLLPHDFPPPSTVAKVAGVGGFTPVPQRWKSERTFAGSRALAG